MALITGFVPPKRFALANPAIVSVVADRYEGVVGGEIPSGVLAGLSAQIRLETGGEPWNWNLGNIRGHAPDGSWTSFSAGEIIDGIEVVLPPGSANKFRAYATLDLGADDFLRLLCLGKFAPATARLEAHDVAGFVHTLRQLGYFTASERAYGHGVVSVEQALAKLPQMAAYFRSVHL